ncbi:hypothetical protein RIF29_38150 [Crotalaria pallida]|uniref:Methyltransferase n=1 Tax=Crotalaria pallida TaxID=3830 RepID=A0AAN9E158_CROPI
MATQTITDTAQKLVTPETLRVAAKQSERCLVVPVHLCRAIKKYLQEMEEPHMKRKVLRLSQSFNDIKDVSLHLANTTSREILEDPLKSLEQSKRWKIQSSCGDIGLMYSDEETIAYVASRMPAVYSACHRVLKEVRRRLPGFSPAKVLEFGARTGSAFWALREVWPKSLEKVNLIEPSQSMPCRSEPHTSYDSIQALSKSVGKSERGHDLVIVKHRKSAGGNNEVCKDLTTQRAGAFVVAPCPHDGVCPLVKSGKFCHFVQRLERTSSQRAYKRSKGVPLRGFEDEKFSFVVFRRGQRPRQVFELNLPCFSLSNMEPWPLDGMEFEPLNEQHAKRNPEELEIDYEDWLKVQQSEDAPGEEVVDAVTTFDSDAIENEGADDDTEEDDEVEGEEEETGNADLGGGWGRIVRGRQVTMSVCRSTNMDASEGSYDRIVVTKTKNPTLHHQASKSIWGDLWPFCF